MRTFKNVVTQMVYKTNDPYSIKRFEGSLSFVEIKEEEEKEEWSAEDILRRES